MRRLALAVATYRAVPPPGVPGEAFARAALADTYEVLAGLQGVRSGIAGPRSQEDLLWPGSILIVETGLRAIADRVSRQSDAGADVIVLVPADVPDLPQLVVAKVFRALVRATVCVAAERGGSGVAALGLRLPWPTWLPDELSLDHDPYADLTRLVPDRRLLSRGPEWHRLRTPGATDGLDPGLEGWEETRALLEGRPLGRSSGRSV